MSVFEASDAESVEGFCKFRVAEMLRAGIISGVRMPRPNFFVAGAMLLKHLLKIAKTYCNSEAECLVNMSFMREVATKRFVLKFQA